MQESEGDIPIYEGGSFNPYDTIQLITKSTFISSYFLMRAPPSDPSAPYVSVWNWVARAQFRSCSMARRWLAFLDRRCVL